MRMILLKDVPGLGKRHEVKEVSAGYARNFLIPKELAQFAAPKAMAALSKSVSMEEAEDRVHKDLLRKNIEGVADKTVTVKENANDQGHLFAGIHQREISEILERELRLGIPPELIALEKPIKELGSFPITIGKEGVTATFTLLVERK